MKKKKPTEAKKKEITKKDLLKHYVEKISKKEIRKLIARDTLYEAIGEDFISTAKALRAPKPFRTKVNWKKPQDEEEMVLCLSDTHIGLRVIQREVGGIGNYNFDVFKERMKFLIRSLGIIFEIHFHNTPYKVFNVLAMGDIVESRVLRPSQLRLTTMPVVEQVMEAVDQIANLLRWLAKIFPRVNFFAVVGQHGRLNPDKSMHSPQDNFDYLVYHWVKERLRNHKNIHFHISPSWWMLIRRMDQRIYIEHGDQFKSWMKIPAYGLLRGRAWLRELLMQYLDDTGREANFDLFVVGHKHTPADLGDLIMNGAWVGGDEFALKNLKRGHAASQQLFSIHPNFGKTWLRTILLGDPSKKPIIKYYS